MFTFALDKKRLLEHFRKDPVLFGYHLGDLDDRYFPHCQFACTYSETAHIHESVLIYSGLSTPTVLAFGLTDQFGQLLEDLLPLLPLRFYCHYQPKERERFQAAFMEHDLGLHFKMRLTDFKPVSLEKGQGEIRTLAVADADEVSKFYQQAYPDGYFEPHMLESGRYVGMMQDQRLVSVAGVHVHSPVYQIAVLGGIATLPEYRGRGLATVLTSYLCEQFVRVKMLVCLNVKADNEAAIRSYGRVGFQKTHEYQEALFELKR